MPKENRPAAPRRLDEGSEGIEALAFGWTTIRIDLLLQAVAGARKILRRPEEPGLRRLSVAAGASGFLIESLDGFGDARMRDEAHVRLVDAHAEGDRRRDHHFFRGDERRLVTRADR